MSRKKINYSRKKNPDKKRKKQKEEEYLLGTYIANEKGFGFVTVEGYDEDFFIHRNGRNGAFYNDTVLILPIEGRDYKGSNAKRREAKVEKIVAHNETSVVGTFEAGKRFGFVLPDNRKIGSDIYIPKALCRNAKDGQKVVCDITFYGSKDRKPEGKITKVLGDATNPRVQVTSIVKSFGIADFFNEDTINETTKVPDKVDEKYLHDLDCFESAKEFLESEKAIDNNRVDFRNLFTITIDGEDAKDLDDAVTIEKDDDGYILGVHIADVSEYVKEGGALDNEALSRGTSVYFADRVIPMLPKELSNGICSLNEGVDRLALSCVMKVSSSGKVVSHRITESVIKVNKRCSYNEIFGITNGDEAIKELADMTEDMLALSDIIRNERYERGAVDFDFPESKIIVDDRGYVLNIMPYDRNRATKIIEDFMLLANETVAEHFYWLDIPFAYRVHEKPDSESMKSLSTFIKNFGYNIHLSGEVHPKELQKLLDTIEGSDAESIISRITLRSMQRAKYEPECTGHFGLAAKYYCHFTSPIRRYPDLQIHRIIKEYLRGELSNKRISHYREILGEVCNKSSALERRAQEAEREAEKFEKVMFMQDKIGEVFDGVISGVTKWGLFVELPNTVEGLVNVSSIRGDIFELDQEHYELYGKTTSKVYKLGQKVQVWLYDTDSVLKTIDFRLVEGEEDGSK